ncbi:hypothetical protein [Glycomyces xiaoerkulensis]|uniref:hypothetical protein n=1 Tax=Glycomyces xiaoerkulensis TaxID=2038139 RepID=UPI0012FFDEBB|nr:hypothetical protein [Glycomyces xiaoerkulensis]
MGLWDDITEWTSDKWDDFTDWLNDDDRYESIDERELNDGELDSAPKKDDILENLEKLEPIMLEGYRREEAYQRYRDYVFRTHNEELRSWWSARKLIEMGGGYVKESHHIDEEISLSGFYRWSDKLELFMPKEVPNSVAEEYHNGESFQQSWQGTDGSDDDDIDEAVNTKMDDKFGGIVEAYNEFMDQCDLPAMQELISQLESVNDAAVAIHDDHYESECRKIRNLFDEWDGDDADVALEKFGFRIEDAVSEIKLITSHLWGAAAAEGTAQATVMIAGYNHIATAWNEMQAKLHPEPSAGAESAARYTGSTILGEIPIPGLSRGINAVDTTITVTTDGDVKSPITGTVGKLIIEFAGSKEVPDGEACDEVAEKLIDGANDCTRKLEEAREIYTHGQEGPALWDKAEQVDNYWPGNVDEIVPGYID